MNTDKHIMQDIGSGTIGGTYDNRFNLKEREEIIAPMALPKLKLKDKLWVMCNNKPEEVWVTRIDIEYGLEYDEKRSRTSILYRLSNGTSVYECTSSSPGDIMYFSKKELLESL